MRTKAFKPVIWVVESTKGHVEFKKFDKDAIAKEILVHLYHLEDGRYCYYYSYDHRSNKNMLRMYGKTDGVLYEYLYHYNFKYKQKFDIEVFKSSNDLG